MGAHVHPGTMPGAVTPICNLCGVSLCWDISEGDYARAKPFWDGWVCQDCNGGKPLSLKHWRASQVKTTLIRDTHDLKIALSRDAGHPWHGFDDEGSWDLLEIVAASDAGLRSAIRNAERKHWMVWLQGRQSSAPNADPSDPFGAVMYKPSGATAPWADLTPQITVARD
jgi:hypothetical protein